MCFQAMLLSLDLHHSIDTNFEFPLEVERVVQKAPYPSKDNGHKIHFHATIRKNWSKEIDL